MWLEKTPRSWKVDIFYKLTPLLESVTPCFLIYLPAEFREINIFSQDNADWKDCSRFNVCFQADTKNNFLVVFPCPWNWCREKRKLCKASCYLQNGCLDFCWNQRILEIKGWAFDPAWAFCFTLPYLLMNSSACVDMLLGHRGRKKYKYN